MKATIDLRIIINDLAALQFDGSLNGQLSDKQLLEFISRLNNWVEQLPSALAAENISLPCQLKIQCVNIFVKSSSRRNRPEFRDSRIRITALHGADTDFIFSAEYSMLLHSIVQAQASLPSICTQPSALVGSQNILSIQKDAHIRFETIMRLWYLRHSFSSYDAWVTLFLTYLGNLALNALNSNDNTDNQTSPPEMEGFRSTIVLCINGLNSQSHCVYIGALLSRSMVNQLSMDERVHLNSHISPSGSQAQGPFDSSVSFL